MSGHGSLRRLSWAGKGAARHCSSRAPPAVGCKLYASAPQRRRGIRLLAIDRPGCGRTSRASTSLPHQLVEDLEEALDAFQLVSAPAVAVSGGVAAALIAATALRERIECIVIGSGLGLLDARGRMEGASMSNKALSLIARRGAAAARTALALPYLMSRLTTVGAIRVDGDDRLHALVREMRETFQQGTRGPARDLATACRIELLDLAAVGQRVVAWHGSSDRQAPLPAMLALVERLPNASLHVLEGADHFVFESHADLMLAELEPPPRTPVS